MTRKLEVDAIGRLTGSREVAELFVAPLFRNPKKRTRYRTLTDNGSPYQSEYDEVLESKKVVHLRNSPHTPRHNAVAERAVRELKDEAKLVLVNAEHEIHEAHGKAVLQEWQIRTRVATERIRRRPRSGFRLGRTCEELDKSLPEAEDLVHRNVFYVAATEAMAAARQAHDKPRAKRNAERSALILVLLKFGLVRVLVGGVPLTAEKAEVYW